MAPLATMRPAVPTLPSRAHPQDYGRRHNSLKLLLQYTLIGYPDRVPYYYMLIIFGGKRWEKKEEKGGEKWLWD